MSFPKASRFIEKTGCAPPVGSYDPKQKEKSVGSCFDKGGDRFKAPKDVLPGPGSFDIDGPKKLNASTCSNGMDKKKPHHKSVDNVVELSKIKDLEREIKKLVQERANQDKQLSHREEDIVKLEGRLQAAHTDKISLQAKIASLEKEIKELRKSNEVLKNKVSSTDNAAKKQENLHAELSSLKHQVELKNKEIRGVKHELEAAVTQQSDDLLMFNNLVLMLETKVQQIVQDKEMKSIPPGCKRNGSEDRIESSHKIREKLQKRFNAAISEIEKKIQHYKDQINKMAEDKVLLEQSLSKKATELQDVRDNSLTLEKSRDNLNRQYTSLQKMVKEMKSETWNQENHIRHLKGEIFSKDDSLKEEEQILFEVRAERASLVEKQEILEEENGTLNENIKSLSEKYHVIENRLAEEQNQNNIKSDQIQSQLDVTKTHLLEIQEHYRELQSKNKQLVHSINNDKEMIEKLTYQYDEQTQLTAGLQSLVESKEDNITDLEISLEATKVELQNIMDIVEAKEADILELKHKISSLKVIERSLEEELEREKELSQRTAREHADRILELETQEIAVKEELNRAQTDRQTAQEQINKLEIKLRGLNKENTQLTDEIELLEQSKERNQMEALEQINKLEIKLRGLNKENSQLTDEIELLEQSKERNQMEALEQHHKSLEEAQNKVEQLEKEKLELCEKLQKISDEKEALSKQFTGLVTSLEEVRNISSEKEADWQSDYQRLTNELQTITEERDVLQQAMDSLEEEKSALKELIKHLELKIDQLEEGSKRNQETIDKLIENKEEISHENQTLKSVNQTLQTALENKQTAMQSLENDVAKLTQEIHVYKDYKVKYEDKIKDIATMETDITSKVKQMESLKVKVQNIEAGEKMLKQQVLDIDKLVESLSEENKRLEKDLDIKLSAIDKLTSDYESELDKLKSEVKGHITKNEELSQNVSKLEMVVKDKDNDITSCQDKYQEMVKVREQENRTFNEKIQYLIESNDKEVTMCNQKISQLEETLCGKDNEITHCQGEIQQLHDRLLGKEKEVMLLQERLSKLDIEKKSTEDTERLSKELECARESEDQLRTDLQTVQSAIESLTEEKELMAQQYEDELAELRDTVSAQEEQNWKKLYEDLMVKVGPFMEQLDAYEMEKAALLGRNQYAQAEMDRLSSAYVKLLGHQNHKQKIHHIMKIKEENNSLKKEATALREQIYKLKRSSQKMEDKMAALEGKKKFDHSKAFQHKENTAPPSSPLKDGNRK